MNNTKDQTGLALITVLWVIALLMVIVVEFSESMKTEVNITRNLKEEVEAYFLAKAGINLAIAEIIQDNGYHYLGQDGEVYFSELKIHKRKDIPFGYGFISYNIIDEERKYNINSSDEAGLIRLFGRADDSEDTKKIADSILDWLDDEEKMDTREHGAEDEYYMSLYPPYGAKDGKLDSIDELIMVKGITSDILYGSGDGISGLEKFITTKSSSMNYNTASKEVLVARMGEIGAEVIIKKRDENMGIYPEVMVSTNFTVIAEGKFKDSPIHKKIKACIERVTSGNKKGIRITCWDDDYF